MEPEKAVELLYSNVLQDNELDMILERNRLESYRDWCFDDHKSNCTSAKLAEAGFYSNPSTLQPDNVKCFVCQKELEGWEAEDEPWDEHKSHSTMSNGESCPFILLGKKESGLTVGEFLDLISKRNIRICQMENEKLNKMILDASSKVNNKLDHIVQSK